jgi:putative membrane protein
MPGRRGFMGILVRWLLNAIALFATAYILKDKGFVLQDGFFTALKASFVMGIINATIRPIILFFTVPINLLTLGLFTFVVNAMMLYLTSWIISDFQIKNVWAALIGSILISLISTALSLLVRR